MKKTVSIMLIVALLFLMAGCVREPEEFNVDVGAGSVELAGEPDQGNKKDPTPPNQKPETDPSTEVQPSETVPETPSKEEQAPKPTEPTEEPAEEDPYPRMTLATERVIFEEAFPELQKPENFKGFTSVTKKKKEIIVTFDPSEMVYMGNVWDPYLHPKEDKAEDGVLSSLEEYRRFLKEGGLIVAGRLEGERESHYKEIDVFPGDEIYTLADLRVEHVFAGKVKEGEVLKLREDYYPLYIDSWFPYRYTHNFTKGPVKPLDNGRLRLFLLQKCDRKGSRYELAHPVRILQEDYLDYDEDYLNSLLDYYRGDPEACYPTFGDESATYKEDGTVERICSDGVNRELDVPNEQIYEEKIAHSVFLNLVVDHKIKIWPEDHKNYKRD